MILNEVFLRLEPNPEVQVPLQFSIASPHLYCPPRSINCTLLPAMVLNVSIGHKSRGVKLSNMNVIPWDTGPFNLKCFLTHMLQPRIHGTLHEHCLSTNVSFMSHFISSHLCCHSPSRLFWKTWQQRDKLPLNFIPVIVTALSDRWMEDGRGAVEPAGACQKANSVVNYDRTVCLSEWRIIFIRWHTRKQCWGSAIDLTDAVPPTPRIRIPGERRIYTANNRVN